MSRKIIFIIILLNCITARAETLCAQNGQINNKIEKEGRDYDTSLNPPKLNDAERALFPTIEHGQKAINNFDNPYIGQYVDSSFGKSQYDKNINWEELLYSGRSLEDIRTERRNDTIKEIAVYVVGSSILFFILLLLIKMNKKN